MADRLITSGDIEVKIIEIQSCLKLSTKASVIRLCIGLSLKEKGDPRIDRANQLKDNSGSNYHKHTIFGDDEELYYLMVKQSIFANVNKNEFFPEIIKAHIIRGMEILFEQYSLLRNPQKITEWIIRQTN